VFLYQRQGKTWQAEAELEAEDGRPGDGFGNAVALYGRTVVVGASHADPELGGGRVTSAGAAYVFSDTGQEWKEVAELTAANSLAFDQFGEAVDIDHDTLVVGADGATQMGNAAAGAVYVFQKSKGGWSLQTRAVTNPAGEDDLFGGAVALSREWFVAGASGRDPGSRTRAGEAFLNLLGAVQLPATGFAPGVQTRLPVQPEELAYTDSGGMSLEIPALGEELSVVGVPKSGSGWDVRWLGEQAGYLEGTAFPTWQGNSALAGHATLANGKPGPFAGLDRLRWGDKVIVQAWGQRYIYEVRQNSLVAPGDVRVLRHEELSWVTLITCQSFDELNNAFRWRRIVRAVLVAVDG
jgi:LPXTG-site transpeptidase (sortase) family protein